MSNPQDLSTFSARLLWARKRSRMTQNQVAGLSGMSQANYSKLEKVGDGSKYAPQLARVLKISPQWLADGTGDPADEHAEADYISIRHIDAKVSAGIVGCPLPHEPEDREPVMIQRAWAQRRGYNPARLFAIRVSGASMEPGIHAGDSVVINTSDIDPVDGVVFAVNYEGEAVIKRLTRDGGAWWLDSDNPDKARYPRKLCTSAAMIIGRVVYKQSEFL